MSKSANEFACSLTEFLLTQRSGGLMFTVLVTRNYLPIVRLGEKPLVSVGVEVTLDYEITDSPASMLAVYSRSLEQLAAAAGWTIRQSKLEICGNAVTETWEAHA